MTYCVHAFYGEYDRRPSKFLGLELPPIHDEYDTADLTQENAVQHDEDDKNPHNSFDFPKLFPKISKFPFNPRYSSSPYVFSSPIMVRGGDRDDSGYPSPYDYSKERAVSSRGGGFPGDIVVGRDRELIHASIDLKWLFDLLTDKDTWIGLIGGIVNKIKRLHRGHEMEQEYKEIAVDLIREIRITNPYNCSIR